MRRIILSIILLSIYTFATPTTYNNTGLVTKLEEFIPTCSYYSSIAKKDLRIKSLCKKYEKNMKNTLKLGYKLDKNISDNSQLLDKYRTKLFSLEEIREQIIEKVSIAKTKARDNNDATYHERLIRKDVIPLYKSDYEFVAKHRDVYIKADNRRYLKMVKDGRKELLTDKEQKVLLQEETEKENREKIDACTYEMTRERHSDRKIGKISQGRITGSNNDGLGVRTKEGFFLIEDAPYYAKGKIKSPIYVQSSGKVRLQPKISLNDPRKGNAYHFYMKKAGLYDNIWYDGVGYAPAIPDKLYFVKYSDACSTLNRKTTSNTRVTEKQGCPEMTMNRHSRKGSGKLTHGKITNGNKKYGYYLETNNAVYKILGAPKLAFGQIASPIYITSKGETEWIWVTSAVNAKKTWNRIPGEGGTSSKKGLIVHYNDTCTK